MLGGCLMKWLAEHRGVECQGYLLCREQADITLARKVFDKKPIRNSSSRNTILIGYYHNQLTVDAIDLFEQMPEFNLVSWIMMISGFVLIERHSKAYDIFHQPPYLNF
jgi:pentatricopeptide repeat protein